mmetsp:Transcript_17678/g.25821  ORF Transcript_17678/g.25821 Transcript_17678/m.25821 type:complete len:99 (-) Transcript_17678:352-648(-)
MIFAGPIEWRPDGLSYKQSHCVNHIRLIGGEAMVDPFGKRHQIPLLDMHADPPVFLVPDIKKSPIQRGHSESPPHRECAPQKRTSPCPRIPANDPGER